ncbi:hypothetical protein [Nakamurella deserti]|uniref:hypothetical protein n=1 Tax=Nakamurella deserti TaxID=2164074 RepID=UPI000DBE92F1|nr:hypothetical protein [Nakamurella deserti]
MPVGPTDRRRLLGLLLVAATVLTWWVFLGRDTTYQRDPDSGVTSGPYEQPQILACAAVLALLAIGAGWWLRRTAIVVLVTGAFTLAWSAEASSDETGLWLVGAIGVLVGCGAGMVLATWLGDGLRSLLARRSA